LGNRNIADKESSFSQNLETISSTKSRSLTRKSFAFITSPLTLRDARDLDVVPGSETSLEASRTFDIPKLSGDGCREGQKAAREEKRNEEQQQDRAVNIARAFSECSPARPMFPRRSRRVCSFGDDFVDEEAGRSPTLTDDRRNENAL